MKVEFGIEKDDILHIRYMYCKECRNYQFEKPVKLTITFNGNLCTNGVDYIIPIFSALEGIAWIPGMVKRLEFNLNGRDGICVKLEDYENEEV